MYYYRIWNFKVKIDFWIFKTWKVASFFEVRQGFSNLSLALFIPHPNGTTASRVCCVAIGLYLTRSTALCWRSLRSTNRRSCESVSSSPPALAPTTAASDCDSFAAQAPPEAKPGRFVSSMASACHLHAPGDGQAELCCMASACSWTRVRSSMAHWRRFHSVDQSRQNTRPASQTTSVATSNAGPIIYKHLPPLPSSHHRYSVCVLGLNMALLYKHVSSTRTATNGRRNYLTNNVSDCIPSFNLVHMQKSWPMCSPNTEEFSKLLDWHIQHEICSEKPNTSDTRPIHAECASQEIWLIGLILNKIMFIRTRSLLNAFYSLQYMFV